MAMYGYVGLVGLCMAMYVYVWLYRAMCGHVWLYRAMCGHVWLCLVCMAI